MKRNLAIRVIIGGICLLVFSVAISGQSTATKQSGLLTGIVVDKNDSRISDARVIVRKKRKIQTFNSNEIGEFSIRLAPGKYNLKVTKKRFKSKSIQNIVIRSSSTTTVEIKLDLVVFSHLS